MHTEAEQAYLAGLIDGEGHISLTTTKAKWGTRTYTLVVGISNNHRETLEGIAQEWDGSLTALRMRRDGWKAASSVVWSPRRAEMVLREVYPFLRIKRAQCEVALAYLATLNPPEHRTAPVSDAVMAERDRLKAELTRLNGRKPMGPNLERLPREPLTCQQCGQQFDWYSKLRKYCSPACNLKAGRDAYYQRHSREQVCPVCGETYTTFRKNQMYCSPKCGAQKRVAIRACVVCGTQFHPSTNRQQTCSTSCGMAFRSARRKEQRRLPNE